MSLQLITSRQLEEGNFSHEDRPHNTMRFDVQLAWIQPMIDDGDVSVGLLAQEIRKGILKAVDDVVGRGLDGVPIPSPPAVCRVPSDFLHHELIVFDLS